MKTRALLAALAAVAFSIGAPAIAAVGDTAGDCTTAADNLREFSQVHIEGSSALRFDGPDARGFVSVMLAMFPPPPGSPVVKPVATVTVFFVPNHEPEVMVRLYGLDGCDLGITAGADRGALDSVIQGMGTGI